LNYNKKYIWQNENYPDFEINSKKFEKIIQKIKYEQWVLSWIYTIINKEDLKKLQLDFFTSDAINTSLIEWEYLNRDSVRSSISKKIWLKTSLSDSSTKNTDWLISILLDSTLNYKKVFDLGRLFWWHNALFQTGYSNMKKINVAKFRWNEEMQIVSWAIWAEKVHYIAPPKDKLENEMKQFLNWLNKDDDLSIIKAGIAHLWFVIIHPLDDWNWRIARAITDMILAKELDKDIKFYSISTIINKNKKSYYDILEKTTNWDLDITNWIEWFLKILLDSLYQAKKDIEHIFEKTKFWDIHKKTVLNDRQIKVLNKILDIWWEEFEWWINTRKYASMAWIPKLTASRELKDLVEKKCIIQKKWTKWRNISYNILIK